MPTVSCRKVETLSLPVPDTAVCRHCGYSLRGLPKAMCPECGEAFDPADPATYRVDPKTRWYWRWAGPPRRWHSVIAIGLTAFILLDVSSPGVSALCGALGEMAWLLCWVVGMFLLLYLLPINYLVHLAASLRCRKEPGELPPRMGMRSCRGWLLAPICGVLVVTAVYFAWPALIRFHVSRSAFEAVVGSGRECSGEFVGLYYIERVNYHPDGVTYFETGTIMMDAAGILYNPTDNPSGAYDSALRIIRRLGAGWSVAECAR